MFVHVSFFPYIFPRSRVINAVQETYNEREVRDVIMVLADAIHYIHERGIVSISLRRESDRFVRFQVLFNVFAMNSVE